MKKRRHAELRPERSEQKRERKSSWEDVDLFSEGTEEEKKAAEERPVAIKVSGMKKESGKSSVLATDHAPLS